MLVSGDSDTKHWKYVSFMQTSSVALQIKIWTSCIPELLLVSCSNLVIIITFTSKTCNDVRARDSASVREKGTRSDCYITPPPSSPAQEKSYLSSFYISNKISSFSCCYLLYFHPSFCCPSVLTSPGLPSGVATALLWTNWRRKSCAIKTSSSNC